MRFGFVAACAVAGSAFCMPKMPPTVATLICVLLLYAAVIISYSTSSLVTQHVQSAPPPLPPEGGSSAPAALGTRQPMMACRSRARARRPASTPPLHRLCLASASAASSSRPPPQPPASRPLVECRWWLLRAVQGGRLRVPRGLLGLRAHLPDHHLTMAMLLLTCVQMALFVGSASSTGGRGTYKNMLALEAYIALILNMLGVGIAHLRRPAIALQLQPCRPVSGFHTVMARDGTTPAMRCGAGPLGPVTGHTSLELGCPPLPWPAWRETRAPHFRTL